MTEKELRRLKRAELLEILVEQGKEIERLKTELDGAKVSLRDREIRMEQAGSIAEAAAALNGVFDAAQAAAAQYLENVQSLSQRQEAVCAKREEACAQKEEEMRKQCEKLAEKTGLQCEELIRQTEQQCEELKQRTEQQCAELKQRTEQQCAERKQQTEQQCVALKQQTETEVEKKWKTIEERLETFREAHQDLRGLLDFPER